MSQPGFRHEVLFYDGSDEFLAGTVPFLHGALEAGEPALVAVRRKRAEALQAELGPDATEIRFAEMEELGRNPARIIPFWRAFVDEHGERGRSLRGIGEPIWAERSADELDECRRHEQLLNVAFGESPSWSLLCPYDSGSLGDDLLEAASRSHPFLSRAGAAEPNLGWARGHSTVNALAGRLEAIPPAARKLGFDRDSLHEVRALVAAEAGRAGFSGERASDLVTAASELAANSIAHGGGHGVVGVWREDGGLRVDVEDAGSIEDPLVGRRRPSLAQEGGRGVWIANLLCDLVQIRSGSTGTAVRLHMSLDR